jgi:2OG-Fe(II) oxygenase superfamily
MAPKAAKAKATQKKTAGRQSQLQPTPVPNWPPLAPLVPTVNLSLEPKFQDQILLIHNFFTSTLCRDYVSFLSTLPFTTTPGKPKRGEATRVNDRYQIDDAVFAERLWQTTSLQELVTAYSEPHIWEGEVLGLNSNIRVYRYSPGQFFDKHFDESSRLEFGNNRIKARTTWTLLIYLTACEGGETVFYPEGSGRKNDKIPDPIVVGLEPGMALLHKHGDDCLLHEGREVTKGEKWVLRSDLVVKR